MVDDNGSARCHEPVAAGATAIGRLARKNIIKMRGFAQTSTSVDVKGVFRLTQSIYVVLRNIYDSGMGSTVKFTNQNPDPHK